MATSEDIRKLIGKIGSNPELVQQLLSGVDSKGAKDALVKARILKSGSSLPSQKAVETEIKKLLSPSKLKKGLPAGEGERLVEWVAAIATGAAGAAAAACTTD